MKYIEVIDNLKSELAIEKELSSTLKNDIKIVTDM
jgi:hypothetical protein